MTWRYVVGVSFNPVATSAVELAAWHGNQRDLYHVSEFFGTGLGLDALAEEVRRLDAAVKGISGYHGYAPGRNGKRIAEAFQVHYGIPVEFAEKVDVGDWVELVNSDLIAGRMRICQGTRLEAEMMTLRRDKSRLELAEGQDAACSTAWMLTWRNAYHRLSKPRGADQQVNPEFEHERRMLAELQQKVEKDPLDFTAEW